MNDNSREPQLKTFIAKYEGICPLCNQIIVKNAHMIVKLPESIKAEGYNGHKYDAHYAHWSCYRDEAAKEKVT